MGLGLAAMGTARQDVYDLLKTNLYQDDAVTGKCSAFKADNHLRPYQASVFFSKPSVSSIDQFSGLP